MMLIGFTSLAALTITATNMWARLSLLITLVLASLLGVAAATAHGIEGQNRVGKT